MNGEGDFDKCKRGFLKKSESAFILSYYMEV